MSSSTTDRRLGLNGNTAIKAPCLVATTANITLSGEQTIDGVAVVADDRVLVKDQTDQSTNGIYDVSTGSWTRSLDFDGNLDIVQGTLVFVNSGTVGVGYYWVTTANPITIGSSNITFTYDARLTDLAASSGASLIGFIQSGTGAVATDLRTRGRLVVFSSDFATLQEAVSKVHTDGGGTVIIPANTTHSIGAAGFTMYSNVHVIGQDKVTSIIQLSTTPTNNFIACGNINYWSLRNLTIDYNGQTDPLNYGAINASTANDWEIDNCIIKGIDLFGIACNYVQRARITNNYIEKTLAANTQNEGINVSSASGVSRDLWIAGNTCNKTGIDVNCSYSTITENHVHNFKFGAGITVQYDATNCIANNITNNTIYGGTGLDVNSTYCPGIENWSQFTVISGNICFNNSGAGIEQGGQHVTCSDNQCYGNGTGVNRSGIMGRYTSASQNSNYSTYTGNVCYSTGTGTQPYGYADESASLTRCHFSGNNFHGNATGYVNILGTHSVDLGCCQGSATWALGTVTTGAAASSTSVTVNGAAVGDFVEVSLSVGLQSCVLWGEVSSANTVTAYVQNNTGSNKTFASATLRARVIKPQDAANW